MSLLDVSQELLSIVGGEDAGKCLHHQGFCAVLMSGLESLMRITKAGAGERSSPFAVTCSPVAPSRLTSVITGLLHAMKSAIDSQEPKLGAGSVDTTDSIGIEDHVALVWSLDHNEAPSAVSKPNTDVHSVADFYSQLMQALRGITSSVIEEASLNTAKRSLAMTMLAKVTRSLPSPNKHNDVRMQDDEELSRTLHTAQHWICIIQHELHKPDMSFLDPRASSSNSAVTIVSELLSAARFCCLAIRCEKLPRHFKRPLRSLAQNCVECAFASMVSGPGNTGHFTTRGADRERASQMLAWFQVGILNLCFCPFFFSMSNFCDNVSHTALSL